MCIRYKVEFWLPYNETEAEWEQKVRRGLSRPGTNPNGKTLVFFKCQDHYYRRAQCAEPQDGGTYGNRIFDFCYEDVDCFLRLKTLEAQNTEDRKVAERAEDERWPPSMQAEATRFWKLAYDGWTSAYDNHRDCPHRRYQNKLYNELKRANIVMDQPSMPEDQRMGSHPNESKEPISGMPRQYDAPQRRY